MPNVIAKPVIGTRNKFRLTLIELVLLSTGVAALLAWSLQDRTREIVWIAGTLKYHAPEVPDNWVKDLSFRSPRIIPGKHVNTGSELYRVAHLEGWNACRYHFYSDFDLGNFELQGTVESVDLTTASGIDSAATLAYAIGYKQCQSEIDDLLLLNQPDELRRKLARKKAASLPILLIAIFCLVALVIIRWKRNTNRIKPLQPKPSY